MVTHVLGPTVMPILHLHLLRRCNLRCLHCYSSSGPGESDELPLPEALAAVDMAAAWGYKHVAVSGGEPMLYRHLDKVLERVLELGLSSSVVTNGLQATRPEMLETLRKCGNVTVSLDGAAPRHDAMRRRDGAFDAALRAIEALASSGIDCGVAYGATRSNLDDLETTLQVVTDAGGSYAHVHAVEAAGRAADLAACLLDRDDARRLYVLTRLLALQSDRTPMMVHCDLIHRDRLLERPGLVYAVASGDERLPAVDSLLGVLVVEPDGAIVPVCYGFDRAFQIGTLPDVVQGGSNRLRREMVRVLSALGEIGGSLLRAVQDDADWTVLNPSEALARHASSLLAELLNEEPRGSLVLPGRGTDIPARERQGDVRSRNRVAST